MNTNKYMPLIIDLIMKGVNFEKDVFLKNSGENWGVDWNEIASNYGYRKPKDGYFSKGGHFYMMLQRIYRTNKGSIINEVAEKTRLKTVYSIK